MESISKVRGRPRSFDREAALEQAMLLFWEHGYEATSLSQLTSAMGISPPSLYAAFGDKQALFLQAVDRYVTRGGAGTESLMRDAKTAREAVAHFLEASAQRLANPHFPRGCMVVLAAASCSEEAAPVQHKLAACRAAWERSLRQRIEQGIEDGDVPATASPAALASFYMAVVQGMSLHAKDGASRKRLQEIAETALQAWPASARREKAARSHGP
ncbi:MAG TPA: TetR/AcrR family transcriptional regulator [Polyangiaceae bacterium]|nr:TetR/AcrR family transcriptional regulator [Polyangiaceae bacterium]